MKFPGFLVVSTERATAPNFFAALWQADQDPAFESALKPSIVQREAPNTCPAKNIIPTFQIQILLGFL